MCVMAAIGLIGSVVSGIGAAQQAKAQQASLNAQAAAQKREIEVQNETARFETDRTQDKIDRTLGAQRAGFIASGVGLTGSAGDILAETQTEGDLDIASIRYNSKARTDRLGFESQISKMNADAAGRAAPLAFIAPVLGGAARFAGAYEDYKAVA